VRFTSTAPGQGCKAGLLADRVYHPCGTMGCHLAPQDLVATLVAQTKELFEETDEMVEGCVQALEDIVLGTSSNPQATLASRPEEVLADESPL
jgi:hypothetical protein